MEARTNAGYEIIGSIPVGNTEIVLGENKNFPSPYVTWHCKNGNSYYHGHYFTSESSAKRDFCKRALEEIRSLEHSHRKHEAER